MFNFSNLFGRSPFTPLQAHLDLVTACVNELPPLFEAFEKKQPLELEKVAQKIAEVEHQADLAKNDIRNHLPKGLFMPIARNHLLEILELQDRLADCAEDIAVLLTIKPMELTAPLEVPFKKFLNKNLEAFEGVRRIMMELHELLESSFGGQEAEKVKIMVNDVAYKEHQSDLIQREVLKILFSMEDKMSYSTFFLWQKIFEAVASLSDLSERLADRVRMTLDLKN